MSKVNCPCGVQLSNIMGPSRNNGWFISDFEADKIEEWDEYTLIVKGRDVWECYGCGRIAFGDRGTNAIKWYLPEDGVSGLLTPPK